MRAFFGARNPSGELQRCGYRAPPYESKAKKRGADQAPHKPSSTQQIQLASNNAIASALQASMRAQSPFLIQLLSSIQVPPTHITLGSAM